MVRKAPKSNIIQFVLFVSLLGILWILSGWNTNNADIDNYILEYGYVQEGGFSFSLHFGYSFLQYIFVLLGIDFETYRIIIYGIGLFFLGRLFWRWSPYPILTLLFYVSLHYLRDVIQMRNFIASVFVISLIDFFGKTNKSHKVAVILLIFIAFSIHLSFFVLFILLLTEKVKCNYWKTLGLSFVLAFLLQSFYLGGGLYLFSGLLMGGEEKVDEVMEILPKYALYLNTILACYNGICISYFNKLLKHDKDACNAQIGHLRFESFSAIINNMNALSTTILIFTVINGAFFSRTFVNITLINIIYFSNVIYFAKGIKSQGIILLLIYVSIFSFFLKITPYAMHLQSVLNNNAIFG